MKVAYICHHERHNYEYAWLASMPVEKVKFITTDAPPPGPANPKIEHCQVKYRKAGWENHFFASTASRVFYSDFEQYLEDIDVVVVLEVFSSLSRQFVEYCRRVGKPVVVLVYELIATHPIYRLPRYRSNTRYVLANADRFIAVSQAAGHHLEKLGAPAHKVKVVYPGIDTKLFAPHRTGRTDTDLAFVGKLAPHKGLDLTLDLYRRLLAEFPRLRLTIAGSGGWQERVEAFAAGHPGVTFIRQVPNAGVPAMLGRHGVYVLPARDTKRLGQRIGAEQFGFSVVEAMACGLAVITTDCGALAEIATSKNIICDQNDAEGLYRRTRELLQHPERIREIGEYNRRLAVERYDLSKQAAALASGLLELAKPARAGA